MLGESVTVEELPDGGVRIVARDWPYAPIAAVVTGVVGVPLLVWGIFAGHAVEAGGAAVFCAFSGFSAWVALAKRRVVELREGVLRAQEGKGPFRSDVEHDLPAECEVIVEPFAVPDGAPDLPDRGGDLVLRGREFSYHLARCVGPGWRRLDELRERVSRAISA